MLQYLESVKRTSMGLGMPHQYAASLKRNVHPFVKIQRNRIGSFDPEEFGLYILREHGNGSIAPSRETKLFSLHKSANAFRSSTAPVLTVPALQ